MKFVRGMIINKIGTFGDGIRQVVEGDMIGEKKAGQCDACVQQDPFFGVRGQGDDD